MQAWVELFAAHRHAAGSVQGHSAGGHGVALQFPPCGVQDGNGLWRRPASGENLTAAELQSSEAIEESLQACQAGCVPAVSDV